MSRTYSSINNKHQKQSKVSYQSYLSNPDEPQERMSDDIPAELEAELLENSGLMKQEFRRLARRMRSHKRLI